MWCCALVLVVVVGVPAGPSSTLMHIHGEGAASFYSQRAYASATSPWDPTGGPFSFCLCLTVMTCSDRVCPSHHPHSLPALSGQGLVGREGKCSKESRHILLLTPFSNEHPERVFTHTPISRTPAYSPRLVDLLA